MHVRADAIQETSTTSGNGPLTLDGATGRMRPFSAAMAEGDTCYCRAEHAQLNEIEEFVATMTGGKLVRGAIIVSSAGAGIHVTFSTGPKIVSLVNTATKALEGDPDNIVRAPALTLQVAAVSAS